MKILFAAVVPLALAGCVPPVLPLVSPLTRAADPTIIRSAPPGPAVIHTARPLAEPGDWRRLNDAQGPGASS